MARKPIHEVRTFMNRYHRYLNGGHTHQEAYLMAEEIYKRSNGSYRYSSYDSFRVALHHYMKYHHFRPIPIT